MAKTKSIKGNTGHQHKAAQKQKFATALAESTLSAKKAKKGKAGIVAQMKKRGYIQIDGKEPILNSLGACTGFKTVKKWKNVGVENAKVAA